MSATWTAHLLGRRRMLAWIGPLGAAAVVAFAGSAAFTVVAPEQRPKTEWLDTAHTCGELGNVDEVCVKRGPWLVGLPRAEAVHRARLYHYLGVQDASPAEAIAISFRELSAYADDEATRALTLELAEDAWVYAPLDTQAPTYAQLIAPGGAALELAQQRTQADVRLYQALTDKVFEEARNGIVVIEAGNVKAWKRRSSATRGWMALATPFLIAGFVFSAACLLGVLLAGRRLWVTVRIRADDDGLTIGEHSATWTTLERYSLGPEQSVLQAAGAQHSGPALELSEQDAAALERAVQAHL